MRPWLSDQAVDFIDSIVSDKTKVFEWGSGGSTIYLCTKVDSIVSVENTKEWFESISRQLLGRGNVDLNMISHEGNCCFDSVNCFGSGSKLFRGKCFEKYVKKIDEYGMFDFIIVDGRARVACLRRALDNVNVGG
jgi:hypothetical protein